MNSPPLLRFAVGVLATALLTAACTDEPTTPGPSDLPVPEFATTDVVAEGDHMLVMPDGQRPSDDLLAAIAEAGGTVLHTHDDIGVVMASGLSDDAAAELMNRDDVQGIQRDLELQWIPPVEEFAMEQMALPEDFEAEFTDQSGAVFFNFWQWNMRQIRAHDTWAISPGGFQTHVCVLDTGVDPGQLDLQGKVSLFRSASFVPSEPFIEDLNFHGTFVSSLITSNGIGMASVAPDARIIAIKVLNRFGSGTFDAVIDGLAHCAAEGGEVANMSLGAFVLRSATRDLILALRRAVEDAGDHGVLSVASAGNVPVSMDDFIGIAHLPSMIRGVLSVGATAPNNQTDFDDLASYTTHGVRGVDVMAPGGDSGDTGNLVDGILGACSQFVCGDINFYLVGGNGTSFAAPHASGLGSVLSSSIPGAESPRRLTTCIRLGADDLGDPGIDEFYGSGRINVRQTVHPAPCGGI